MAKKATKKGSPQKSIVRMKSGKTEQDFELSHALRILQLKNSAWECIDDDFEFVNNDLKRKASQGSDPEPKE